MSREDFVAIGARLFAVFLFAYMLSFVAGFFQILATAEVTSSAVIGFAITMLVMTAVAALIWVFPLTIARKLLPVMKERRSEESIGASVAMSLAMTAIGVWLLATALVDAAYWITVFARVKVAGVPGFELDPQQTGEIVAAAVQLGIAVWLVFGNAGITRVIHHLKFGAMASSGAR